MARKVLAQPQRQTRPLIDGLNGDDDIRVGERDGAGRAGLSQGGEEKLVEMSFDLRRVDLDVKTAAMEAHVEGGAGQTNSPAPWNSKARAIGATRAMAS